ncbi:MAG TPA: hypothetical protein VMT64_13535 [Candidatus Binataceae bacterium]|nr:hypothetical protein [Candidatus Binataceae bacterium]
MKRMLTLLTAGAIGLAFGASAFAMGGEGAFFDFLRGHPEIRRDIERNPGLANDPAYLRAHPQFVAFFRDHEEVQRELRDNPRELMQHENWDAAHPRAHERAERRADEHRW